MHHGAQNNALYSPPLNFAMVVKDVYRSAYPTLSNLPYLRDIGIKTLALLSIEALPAKVLKALEEPPKLLVEQGRFSPNSPLSSLSITRLQAPVSNDTKSATLTNSYSSLSSTSREIRVLRLANMRSWRDDAYNSGCDFSQRDVIRGLDIAVDPQWHPVLFACPTGELQTNVLVGCIRRLQNWSLSSIFNECELFTSLTRTTSPQVLNFISMWLPEDNPMNVLDVITRNREWVKQVDGRPQEPDQPKKSAANAVQTQTKAERALPLADGNDNDDDGYSANKEDATLNVVSSQDSSIQNPGNAKSLSLLLGLGAPSGKEISSILGAKESDNFQFAEWYLQTLREFSVLGDFITPKSGKFPLVGLEKAATENQLPPPHVLFAGVRNPPSLDPRSSFTKESIVEEDDD
ncbi:unnamed protein product [Phytomonas sp. Hart1]|nr:unnamed protein product [Phytomonas sp. Hart1]|eukprot:CCW70598.1 unnamed protein product [Phytomonas sp. isolate Hart1]